MLPILCPVIPSISVMIVGLLWVVSGMLLPPLFFYRLLWRVLYGRGPILVPCVRLRGKVVGPDRPGATVYGHGPDQALISRPFIIAQGDLRVVVTPARAPLKGLPRRVRVGDRITVDGVHESVATGQEHLYRDASRTPGIEALQIARGTLPELRRLMTWLLVVWSASSLFLLGYPMII